MFDWLFGAGGGARQSDLRALAARESFSQYLPWRLYDPERRRYVNGDGAVGYLWECSPPAFVGDGGADGLESILKLPLPPGTVLQFLLHADPHVAPFVAAHAATVRRDDPLVRETTLAFDHWASESARDGIAKMSGIPYRNFRLFVAVSVPDHEGLADNDLAQIVEQLDGAGLAPKHLAPPEFLAWLRRLHNRDWSGPADAYDETCPLNKQVLLAEDPVGQFYDHLEIGGRHLRCLTPKVLPKETDLRDTAQLSGGIYGASQDAEQITAPFLYTVSVIFGSTAVKNEIHGKATLIGSQRAAGSFSVELSKKMDEYTWALDVLERANFQRVVPVLWILGHDAEHAGQATARARRVFESRGYVMQEDRLILVPLWLAALPFGLRGQGANLKTLDRHFLPPSDTTTRLLPTQGDFSGGGQPVICLVGRKGQACGVDLFDNRAPNHNSLFVATSGGGKSFLVNYVTYHYYATGALVRLVDIGYSYKKLSRMLGARFMDFGRERVCINPFHGLADPEQELEAVAAVLAQMAYSASGGDPSESEWTLIKNACRRVHESGDHENGVDRVRDYLRNFPADEPELEADRSPSLIEAAQRLAFNLSDFTSTGTYGRFFNGPSTFDIRSDEFVVLELERLANRRELFRVITLQVLNAVTQDLYLSDRTRKRLVLFDEAWKFLRGNTDTRHMSAMLEEGYRRARKYEGGFGLVVQSPLDLESGVGGIVRSNSAWKFLLESGDYPAAMQQKLFDFGGPFVNDLLFGVKRAGSRYSEMFVETPFGKAVARLVVDPFSYYVYTSKASEVAQIEALVASGMDYASAIRSLMQSGSRA